MMKRASQPDKTSTLPGIGLLPDGKLNIVRAGHAPFVPDIVEDAATRLESKRLSRRRL
jgi:hypothetical protein